VRWTPGRWGLRLQAYIGRRINTRDEDIWSKESWGSNWDIRLKAGLEL
jgi:hypothetical protein